MNADTRLMISLGGSVLGALAGYLLPGWLLAILLVNAIWLIWRAARAEATNKTAQ